ncbi:S-layer homology domain-containing protein [Paenibacillus sp. J2TS4]|uniref:S-layer homology domain-containing protein n=1 Tax=Paenibacillus sp. J2TS4 TaxID=2807194 RepID=UPI001B19EF0F|nr:S-layer homology domain-containing protein [Paenibacillus sp. J2TS4]GIP35105.1 hypothetical protein J2TS4_43150 [Paenibacillus sp. J2TS4]
MKRLTLCALLICSLLLGLFLSPVEAAISNVYKNHTFTATFNPDYTVTVEGTAEEKAGGPMEIDVHGPSPGVKLIKTYVVDVATDGQFKLITDRLEVEEANIYIRAKERTSYWLGVRSPNTLSDKPDGEDMVKLNPNDPLLEKTVDPGTIPAIRAKWQQYAPEFDYAGSLYLEQPLLSSPYSAGKLHEQVLLDALNMTKFARYLAGMSESVELSSKLNESAQHKVVVLEQTYHSSRPHDPAQPADMSDSFYQTSQAWKGGGTSAYENLHYGYLPMRAVASFMDDIGSSNERNVGHRWAILQPDIREVGFGYTDNYIVMHLKEGNYKSPWPEERDYVAWPSAGNFPMLFSEFQMFSILLNPNKFEPADAESLRIEILNKRQKTKWQLYDTANYSSKAGKMYMSSRFYQGEPATFITFSVSGISIQEEDEVSIRITGIKDKSGNETAIEYAIHFFELDESTQSSTPAIDDYTYSEQTIRPGSKLEGLAINPRDVTLLVGEQVQVKVMAGDEQGKAVDVTNQAIFRLMDEKYADYFTVDAQGIVTALKATEVVAYPVEVTYGDRTDMFHVRVRNPLASFNDVGGHWAQEAIQWAAERRIVQGYEDNEFKPEQFVSEAEFLAFFYRPRVDPAMIEPMPDYPWHWADKLYYFAELYNVPVLTAKDEERSSPITRTQVAEIIAAAEGYHLTGDAAIQYMLGKGYSQGKDSNTIAGYRGDDFLTRAEALEFSYRLMDYITDVKKRPEQPTPVSELPPLP